ncbi:Dicer-like protein 1, variant 3 [Xanthoria parietina]
MTQTSLPIDMDLCSPDIAGPATPTMRLPHDPDLAAQHRVEEASNASEESEPEFEYIKPTPQQKAMESKRAYKQKFEDWRLQHAKIVTDEEIRLRERTVADESLSVRELMRKGQPSKITSPREYQIELFERAKRQNTIAVLDTGSGKTLIAVLLLRHILDQELEDRSAGKKHRIAFFLVDSVTLVFQQYEFLKVNLDQPIECFCGEMGTDHWAKEIWQKQLKQNMIILCTAEILHQCLMRSFISMDQINLLIFDEAHHAKKNHPYARIIKDYYIAEDEETKRPRVFGMTASPVDVRSDFGRSAKELEVMLHCQIATTADLALLRTSVSRPMESVAEYEELHYAYSTRLCQEIEARYGHMEVLSKIFKSAKTVASELGEWCADQLWSFAMAEKEAIKVERKIEKAFTQDRNRKPVEVLDAELNDLREAQTFVKEWTFGEPAINVPNLSSKVLVLRQYLNLVYERPTDARCIVFVDQRYTARLLGDLFARIGSPHLRSSILIGTRHGDPGDVRVSFKQQMMTLYRFKKGDLNCLFATSVAEEGLDISDCNLVIRFDLYSTLIQYIQSRGRARHAASKYIHMIEQGNRKHIDAVRDVRQGEAIMRHFCESLPADRILQGNDADLDAALFKEKNFRTFIDPVSGAKLTYASSLVVLGHFVSCLNNGSSPPNFIVTAEHGQYTCEVVLPESSPVHSAKGRPSARKAIAKRSAAFEACVLLRQGGHLDEHLVSTYHKHLPAMRNAHLALNMNKSSSYDMKIKPSIWQDSLGSVPPSLYITIFELQQPENLGRLSQPIALLTRTQMPNLPSVLLHLQVDRTSNMIFTTLQEQLRIAEEHLSKLNAFTLRIYKDIFNKKFEVNEPAMSYWFAPIIKGFKSVIDEGKPEKLLDWAILDYVNTHDFWKWDIECPHDELENRYLVDKWDGGRRFWSIKVLPNLSPQDPVPDDAAPHRYMNTIIDYTVSLFSKSRQKAVWRQDQPVIFAHRILHRLNWLDEYTEEESKVKKNAYVCPEPLLFSALPASVVAMAYLLPSAITRIESLLIALEICDVLDLQIRPDLALEAVTKDSDNTHEHGHEQLHRQRGMGKNYERLEFIGDCFLKMATSISIFCLSPNNDEYEYHVRRMLLICNKNLFNTAVDKELYRYIRSAGFSRRNWYPQGIKLLEGKGFKKGNGEEHKHQLGDKTIADVCEALIGAALLSYNSNGDMDMAVKAVTALVLNPDHNVTRWADYYKLYTKPLYQLAQATAVQSNLALQIERKMGYRFRYPRLLMSAFVHPSLPSFGGIPSYQRLEFLGDSLLDMACVNFLFYRHPDRDPQWLTEHKMAMVSNRFLAALSVKLGFHKHLRFSSQVIEFQNRNYATELEEAERDSNGARDYWTTTKNPPKVSTIPPTQSRSVPGLIKCP